MQGTRIITNRGIPARILNSFLLFIYLLICLTTTPVLADHAPKKISSPDSRAVMPKAWIDRTIAYKRGAVDADVVMVLDQQTYPAFAKDVKRFAKKNSINMVLSEGSCGVSAGGLAKKNIDIGGYCCPPGKNDRLPGLEFHTLGIAPMALLVNRDNPVNNLTVEEIKKIFGGEIYRWSGLKTASGGNGKNIPIQVIGRLHCKNRPGHWRLLFDNEENFSASLREVGTIKDMISQISGNKRAIGYEVKWMAKYHINNDGIKHVMIDGKSPDNKEALLSKEYPLYRTYNLAYWKDKSIKNPHTDRIIAFMEKLIEEKGESYGFISSSELKKAGWKFRKNELISEPVHKP